MSRFLLSVLLFVSASAMAVDEPDYQVLSETEAFELRRYASYVVAEVAVKGNFKRAGNQAFRPLFRFISGENDARQEIAMTAPVTQSKGQKIPMTAPVTQEASGDAYRVGFIMPADMTLAATPVPRDPRVSVRAVPERVVAVRRYGGTWSEGRYAREEQALIDAVEAAGLKVLGEPVWARYNGPMTPWFMRRNEIMIEVDG